MLEWLHLTGPKPKEIEVETFRIDNLTRTPKVGKLSLQPISRTGEAKARGDGSRSASAFQP